MRNEFIGGKYYYSVQRNTSKAEGKSGVSEMGATAKFLGEELERIKTR